MKEFIRSASEMLLFKKINSTIPTGTRIIMGVLGWLCIINIAYNVYMLVS